MWLIEIGTVHFSPFPLASYGIRWIIQIFRRDPAVDIKRIKARPEYTLPLADYVISCFVHSY